MSPSVKFKSSNEVVAGCGEIGCTTKVFSATFYLLTKKQNKMKDEPIDLLYSIMCWVLFTPYTLTENSSKKWLRVFGRLMCMPFALTWIFTGIPFLVCVFVLGIAQIIYDA